MNFNNRIKVKINNKSSRFLRYASWFSTSSKKSSLSRPFLKVLMTEGALLEDDLHCYGAFINREWYHYALLIYIMRHYCRITLGLLHIDRYMSFFKLGETSSTFKQDTEREIEDMEDIMSAICSAVVHEAERLKLEIPGYEPSDSRMEDELLDVSLKQNLVWKGAEEDEKKYAVKIATDFLNIASELQDMDLPPMEGTVLDDAVINRIDQEKIRAIAFRIKDIDYLYDSYIYSTAIEKLNNDLIDIGWHIYVLLNLLEVANDIISYYTKKMANPEFGEVAGKIKNYSTLYPEQPLRLLIGYAFNYIRIYFQQGADISRKVLKRYVVKAEKELSIPSYRGFHVRPSTLVAKIVLHYGSDVYMELDEEKYNVDSPLELFRANEAINRMKRRRLGKELDSYIKTFLEYGSTDIRLLCRQLVYKLFEQKVLILYKDLEIEDVEISHEKKVSLREYVYENITRFLTQGKLDICIDMKAKFIGDKRVLEDINILADNGYGEDMFGHNIPLPSELSYLHRR